MECWLQLTMTVIASMQGRGQRVGVVSGSTGKYKRLQPLQCLLNSQHRVHSHRTLHLNSLYCCTSHAEASVLAQSYRYAIDLQHGQEQRAEEASDSGWDSHVSLDEAGGGSSAAAPRRAGSRQD